MNISNITNGIKHAVKDDLRLFSESVLQEAYTEKSRSDIASNIKRNWYFPVSAMAFFCLSAALNLGYILGLLFAFAAALFVSAQVPSLFACTRKYSTRLQIFSFISAIGICLSVQSSFYRDLMESSKTQVLMAMLPSAAGKLPAILIYCGAIAALFFVYFCLLVFWKHIVDLFSGTGIFKEIVTVEWIVYILLFAGSLVFMILCFAKTDVFYGNEHVQNLIYTSDTRMLVKWNAYMTLTHQENDLRQPLFAVFSAPFTAIPYLVSRLIGASTTVHGILMNSVQVVMLFVSNLMLAGLMKLDIRKRICFMVFTSFTYAQLLFILMMEQYVIACFWLILCIYFIAQNQKPARIALWGTGGTLLTGMIFLPFMSDHSPLRNFKSWFADMVKYGLEFVAVLLAFCRFDVIFNLFSRIDYLSKFTGESVTFADKVYQYTNFILNCFVTANASIDTDVRGFISWQLDTATSINYAGVVIVLLVIVSAIWNRSKKSSLIAAGWIVFSAVLLLGLGWGTIENGLILYALYFGWAFFVLIFQLIEKIESKTGTRFLIPAATVCGISAMLFINIPAITEMVCFAVTYFPV